MGPNIKHAAEFSTGRSKARSLLLFIIAMVFLGLWVGVGLASAATSSVIDHDNATKTKKHETSASPSETIPASPTATVATPTATVATPTVTYSPTPPPAANSTLTPTIDYWESRTPVLPPDHDCYFSVLRIEDYERMTENPGDVRPGELELHYIHDLQIRDLQLGPQPTLVLIAFVPPDFLQPNVGELEYTPLEITAPQNLNSMSSPSVYTLLSGNMTAILTSSNPNVVVSSNNKNPTRSVKLNSSEPTMWTWTIDIPPSPGTYEITVAVFLGHFEDPSWIGKLSFRVMQPTDTPTISPSSTLQSSMVAPTVEPTPKPQGFIPIFSTSAFWILETPALLALIGMVIILVIVLRDKATHSSRKVPDSSLPELPPAQENPPDIIDEGIAPWIFAIPGLLALIGVVALSLRKINGRKGNV